MKLNSEGKNDETEVWSSWQVKRFPGESPVVTTVEVDGVVGVGEEEDGVEVEDDEHEDEGEDGEWHEPGEPDERIDDEDDEQKEVSLWNEER